MSKELFKVYECIHCKKLTKHKYIFVSPNEAYWNCIECHNNDFIPVFAKQRKEKSELIKICELIINNPKEIIKNLENFLKEIDLYKNKYLQNKNYDKKLVDYLENKLNKLKNEYK